MSDLIDRQAAIQTALEFIIEYLGGAFDEDFQKKLIERMSLLPSAQQWTPRSKRSPEDGTYIVYAPDYQGGSSRAKEWHDGVMFSKHKNGKWSIEHGYYERPNCVKAWMPMPEVFSEDDTENE